MLSSVVQNLTPVNTCCRAGVQYGWEEVWPAATCTGRRANARAGQPGVFERERFHVCVCGLRQCSRDVLRCVGNTLAGGGSCMQLMFHDCTRSLARSLHVFK